MNNWKDLLASINSKIIKDKNCFGMKQCGNPDYILNKPATVSEIDIEEKRLGVQLPASYKEFLQQSNGLKILNDFYWNIFPIQKVQWLKNYDLRLVQAYENDEVDVSDEQYFLYDENQRTEFFRGDYMGECLAISGWGDSAILLLNSEIKFGNEWEAWAFANWYPGAVRYKSFWDLVNNQFNRYLEIREKDTMQ
jgi:hypothetical protein